MELTKQLIKKHFNVLKNALSEGLNTPGVKVFKPHKFGGNPFGAPAPKPVHDETVVKAHQRHSKLGKAFFVKQFVRKLSGTGTIVDPVVDSSDTTGFKNNYQIRVPGIHPGNKIAPNTLWVRAKDKASANELAKRYLKEIDWQG